MPVRKIPLSSQRATGIVFKPNCPDGAHHESSLENDFYIGLAFDTHRVARFEPQPVRIPYQIPGGRRSRYTPDVLIEYRPEPTGLVPKPMLAEVKCLGNLHKDRAELIPKFQAASAYAAERGWRFRVRWERHIKTPYLDNAKWLLPHLHSRPSPSVMAVLLDALRVRQHSTPWKLLSEVFPGEPDRSLALSALWHLVANRRIGLDLEQQKFTMESPIWCLGSPGGEQS